MRASLEPSADEISLQNKLADKPAINLLCGPRATLKTPSASSLQLCCHKTLTTPAMIMDLQ